MNVLNLNLCQSLGVRITTASYLGFGCDRDPFCKHVLAESQYLNNLILWMCLFNPYLLQNL